MVYFRVSGSVCYILRDREHLAKFDTKSEEGIFLGYSNTNRAYKVYNLCIKIIMESINVKVDDSIVPHASDIGNNYLFSSSVKENDDDSGESSEPLESDTDSQACFDEESHVMFKDKPKWAISHRDGKIVGPVDKGVRTQG